MYHDHSMLAQEYLEFCIAEDIEELSTFARAIAADPVLLGMLKHDAERFSKLLADIEKMASRVAA